MYLQRLLEIKQKKQKVVVVGLARENRQFLTWLVEVVGFPSGQILLADRLSLSELSPEVQELLKKYVFEPSQLFLGPDYLQVLGQSNVKIVFKSPGIWSLLPEFEAFRRQHGRDSIHSSLVFFWERFRSQIVGVTGTKGKSTVASLTNHLLNKLEFSSHYCGNTTNVSPYTYWKDFEASIDPNEFFVLETSSFQLQDLGVSRISPKYAVLTNYFIDHLDQHAGEQEYWASKDNLSQFQSQEDFCTAGQSVCEKSEQKRELLGSCLGEEFVDRVQNTFQSPLLGRHNWANVAQAFLVLQTITGRDIWSDQVKYQEALSSYQPLPHRLQLVRSERLGNITLNFYDDGYATEPDAVASAVRALSEKENEYVWLQIAGKDKGGNLEELFLAVLETQQALKLFRIDYCGSVGQSVLTVLTNTLGLPAPMEVENFRRTVEQSFDDLNNIKDKFLAWYKEQQENVYPGKPVDLNQEMILNTVLSPAGSSFDEFKNAEERANWWVGRVRGL